MRLPPDDSTILDFGREFLVECPRCGESALVLDRGAGAEPRIALTCPHCGLARAWEAQAGLRPNHANWLEAFPFTRVAALPQGGKDLVSSSCVLNADETRALMSDGVYGGPYAAEAALMERIFEACVDYLVERPRFE